MATKQKKSTAKKSAQGNADGPGSGALALQNSDLTQVQADAGSPDQGAPLNLLGEPSPGDAGTPGATAKDGGAVAVNTSGRATFVKLKDTATRVKQQAAALNLIKKLQAATEVKVLDPPFRYTKAEDLGVNCISVDNDYVDMSKVNILTSMHPYRRANMQILKRHNPKLVFSEQEEAAATGLPL